jgi:hypothetical protein
MLNIRMGSLIENRIITFLIVIYPILHRYRAIIPILTLSEFLMILLLGMLILKRKKFMIDKKTVAIVLYLIFSAIWAIVIPSNNTQDAVGTTARLITIYSLLCIIPTFFDYCYGYRILLKISALVGIYEILQIVFARFGILLTTYIPFLPIMEDMNKDIYILSHFQSGFRFRPYSLLNEPAALCVYLILPLALIMFKTDKSKKEHILAVFLSACCVFSLSATGIMVMAFIWVLYFLNRIKTGVIKRVEIVLLLFVIVSGIAIICSTDIWTYFMTQAFHGRISMDGLMQSTRFRDLNSILYNRGLVETVLGSTLAYNGAYLPGWIRVYYGLGILGVSLFAFYLIGIYKSSDDCQRYTMLIFMVLNIGTEIMLGGFAIYYLSFMLSYPGVFEGRQGKLSHAL